MVLNPVLSGLAPDQLAATLAPLPAFRAKQVFKWLSRAVPSFQEMTDLSQTLRDDLSRRFRLYSSFVSERLEDADGTVKLQLTLEDGAKIEAVILEDGEGRKTACLSTQVGCPLACAFCKTGTLGLLRNLKAAEMVEQFIHLRAIAPEISHIVVMGMGEPLLNLEALRQAVAVLTDPAGFGLSHRRITVSTSGLVAGIRDLTDRGPDLRLALSLTTADPALRGLLMPVTRTNPLPEVKKALIEHQKRFKKRITLEAVLLGGVNTRIQDALALVEFARDLETIVNLIPWNQVDGLGLQGQAFREPTEAETERFARELEKRGLTVTRRYRKGRGVSGACGQLGSTDAFPSAEKEPEADLRRADEGA